MQDPDDCTSNAVSSPRLPGLGLAILLVSASMLMLEILQTITLSLQAMEQNAFLVISLCLLGLGAGGSPERRFAPSPAQSAE